jgi:transcriptional regulator with XRE-family HTH domain
MVNRILELLKYLGMSPSRFADEIGVQRSAMSHLVSGRNNPSLEFALKVLTRFPEISTDWLITGLGDMTRNTLPDQSPLPELFLETNGSSPAKEEPAPFYEKTEPPPVVKPKKTAPKEKGIEKIIIIYNDHTFSELLPEKD